MKLFTLILICAATLLFSGCGTTGFSLGLTYNEWGATIDFKGKAPNLLDSVEDEEAIND